LCAPRLMRSQRKSKRGETENALFGRRLPHAQETGQAVCVMS
jgi:hypothetical protein